MAAIEWDSILGTNRQRLCAIVASLGVALHTMAKQHAVSAMAYRLIQRVLRPAESTLRRLLVIAAARMRLAASSVRRTTVKDFSSLKGRQGAPRFRLIDPRKRFDIVSPSDTVWGVVVPWPQRVEVSHHSRALVPEDGLHQPFDVFARRQRRREAAQWCLPESHKMTTTPQLSDTETGSTPQLERTGCGLARRIAALAGALDHFDQEARRMARMVQRRKDAPAGPASVPPLRPGLPPGARAIARHAVDALLYDCDHFARMALEAPP